MDQIRETKTDMKRVRKTTLAFKKAFNALCWEQQLHLHIKGS